MSKFVSTQVISTLISSFVDSSITPSISSSTSPPLACFYQVPNCLHCTQNAPLFDLTQGNVSCVFSSQQNEWMWTFTPNTGTLTNVGEIVLSGNTTTFVEGEFVDGILVSEIVAEGVFLVGVRLV